MSRAGSVDERSPRKVVALYQALLHYRLPLYKQLSDSSAVAFEVWTGDDEGHGKVRHAPPPYDFTVRFLRSWRFGIGRVSLPFYPELPLRVMWARPDIVLVEGASSPLNALLAVASCWALGIPYVWWSLGKLRRRQYVGLRRVVEAVFSYVARRAQAVVTYSSAGREYFESQGVHPSRIVTAINVVAPPSIQPREIEQAMMRRTARQQGELAVCFAGAITFSKRLEVLVSAVRTLRQKGVDVKVTVIGDGPARESAEKAIPDTETGAFSFVGSMYGSALHQAMLACDVFVLPGLGGLAISEAMWCGLPVVCGEADGTERDLVSVDCGYVSEHLTEEELATVLADFAFDPAGTARKGRNARARMEGRFSFDSFVNGFRRALCISEKLEC